MVLALNFRGDIDHLFSMVAMYKTVLWLYLLVVCINATF